MGRIELVAVDMDNTMIMPGMSETLSNVAAMERAKEMGVRIVPCTARPWYGAQGFFRLFPFDEYAITCNGAGLVDTHSGKIHDLVTLGAKDMPAVLDALLSMEEWLDIRVNTERGYGEWIPTQKEAYREELGIRLFGAAPSLRFSYRDWDAFIEGVSGSVLRILCHVEQTDEALLQKTKERIAHIMPMEIEITDDIFIEITAPGMDKGKRLSQLCDMLQIPREAVMAIGDNKNDISMVSYAGVGVSVHHGHPELKKVADVVAPPYEEGGIYAVIEEYIHNSRAYYGRPARAF